MVGRIPHALELRNLLHQCFLHTAFERLVYCAATLTTATKLQYCDHFLSNFHQAHFAAVSGKRWIDLVIEYIINTIFQRAVVIDAGQFGIGSLDGQLPPMRSLE